MTMRLHNHLIFMLGTAAACAAGPALADGDVTMTVIPSGGDVVKTVVQNITVPANADKVAKGAGPHKTTPAAGQDSEAGQQTAQQLAEAAAEHQAGQTQQLVQQQALQAAQMAAAKARNTSPPTPPPPPRPPVRR
jgi:hypothetical protein